MIDFQLLAYVDGQARHARKRANRLARKVAAGRVHVSDLRRARRDFARVQHVAAIAAGKA